MSKEFLKCVFEPFEQEDASARSQLIGTGLGLAIAGEILDLCDGTISAAAPNSYDMILIDIMMPEMDGLRPPAPSAP